jgi:MFS family permease
MTERNDAYWDELGVAWCAINPRNSELVPRLRVQMRRQTILVTTGLVAGFTLGTAGLLLALFTIWSGWESGAWNLVVRGIAIIVIAVMLLVAAMRLLPVRQGDAAGAVSELIELSIARAQRTMLAIRLGLGACAVAAVVGLAGPTIRMHIAKPPKMSPFVDLAILAVFGLGLLAYGRYIKDRMARMRALRHALAMNGET